MEPKSKPSRPLAPLVLSLTATLVGIVGGVGAVVFRAIIGLFHNILFLGNFSFAYDANVHTAASPWGPFVILVPVIGAAGVAFLVDKFAPEARGHGVPEVIDAIYYNRGRIRPIVAVIKALASALSIGSGGSVGREGPIIQIGSSFGSTLGQLLRIPAWQRAVLIAGGAGAGIAATFNTPVGGVLFAVEIMMHEISARTLVPVALATASGTYLGRVFFGQHPSFLIPALQMPNFHQVNPLVLLSFVGLGILMGAVSALFIKSIYGMEDFFQQRVAGSYYRQHLLGMLGVGVIIYGLMAVCGHYYVEGVGYATVQDILSGAALPAGLLLLLFVLKLLVTSLTLGSGASGGIFSPALFLGATLGSAYGTLVHWIFPHSAISAAAFAVAGMAAVVGGSTGAAMAAIVMIFEMTLDYNVIVPMTITVAVSFGVRRILTSSSIYTMKLERRGHYIPEALHSSPQLAQHAGAVMLKDFGRINVFAGLDEIAAASQGPSTHPIFLVEDDGRIVGVVRSETILKAASTGPVKLDELVDRNYVTVGMNATLFDIIILLRATTAPLALVVDDSRPAGEAESVKGMVTAQQLGEAMVAGSQLFLD